MSLNESKVFSDYALVTGGAGSIGSELVLQLLKHTPVFILDNNETAFFNFYERLKQEGANVMGMVGDVRDKEVFERIARPLGSPKQIFHCSGLKHVTPSAWSREEYTSVNVWGTYNVLDFAEKYNVKVTNISTDKVVNANSIMGATKKLAEIAVRDAGHVSVRFGNVLGSRGSVLELWQQQIDRGEPLTVTDARMMRYMMTIPEACELIIKASEVGESGDILVMDMGEKVNILDLAHEILKKSGKNVGVEMIGARPGEILEETLMTDEEKSRAIKIDNFYVIKS